MRSGCRWYRVMRGADEKTEGLKIVGCCNAEKLGKLCVICYAYVVVVLVDIGERKVGGYVEGACEDIAELRVGGGGVEGEAVVGVVVRCLDGDSHLGGRLFHPGILVGELAG